MRRGMKGRLLMSGLFLSVGALGAIRESHIRSDVVWAGSFQTGMEQARRSGRALLLSFRAPNCAWCRKLDVETFPDPQVLAQTQRCVCVRLDSEIDAVLAARYRVNAYPTTLLVDAQGKSLARIPGYLPPERFAPLLRTLLDTGHS